jgi:hypothetical protein
VILEEGPDVASLMQELSDAMKGYPPGTFPPQVLIECSSLPRSDKDRVLAMLTPKPPPPDPMAEMVKRLGVENLAADVALKGANIGKTHASAEQALATAEEKRAKASTEGVRAHATMSATDIAAAEFSRDTLVQAHQLANPQPPAAPKQQGSQP